MKTFKVILGIIILLATIKTATEVLPQEHGAGLGGAITGFIILFTIGILLIYFGTKNKSEEKTYIPKTKLDSTIENLKDLKEKGILSEDEYKQKTQKIKAEKAEQDLKNSTEYKQLKSLLDSGVLTKEEFESKVDLLKQKEKTNTYNNVDEESILEINSEINKKYLEAYKNKVEGNDAEVWDYMVKVILITLLLFGILWALISVFK